MFGQDAFGMKLHAVDRVFFVADAHDFAFVGFGSDFQKGREAFALDDE